MAKVRHNNFIDTVSGISENAKEKGVMQLYTEGAHFDGKYIRIDGNDLCHFGTTGYLGLEQDLRLKEAAINAIIQYGTQFPLSRTFVSFGIYKELESRLEQMYDLPVVVMKNSTLGHIGVIPTVVRDEDAIILDHQVHWSVQNAAQLSKGRGVPVEMIRHNNMEMLEDKIRDLRSRYSKIWYMADGIYSMYGDVAPIEELLSLCKKYPQLHLYFDDVHGMSWKGKNGTGYTIDQLGKLEDNMVVMATLSKTFGASGAMMVTSNKEFFTKVKNFGGPLTFSAQLEPASVAAASASAAIHLSDEIYQLQHDLSDRVEYCNTLIEDSELPLVQKNDCPVFYIAAGPPAVGYNINKKLLDAGFYVNMGIFPAVPIKQSGVRFTISRHNDREDIKNLIDAMKVLYPKALEEENYAPNMVRRIFKMPLLEEGHRTDTLEDNSSLKVKTYTSASQIDGEQWDEIFSGNGVFDHKGLLFQENLFKNQTEKENNWKFYYFLIEDSKGVPVLATYFTYSIWKEDMLAPASVSEEIEEKRKKDPYHLSTYALAMGSLFTEGEHLFLDKKHAKSKEALDLLMEKVEELDLQLNPGMVALRDFEDDEYFTDYFEKKGFVKIDLPHSCVVEDLSWATEEEYVENLSAKSRRHFRREIAPFTSKFNVTIKDKLTKEEVDQFYKLYHNVWDNNLAFNTYPYNKNLLWSMSDHPDWEFIVLHLKSDYNDLPEDRLLAVMFSYKNKGISYVPSLIGMDYSISREFNVYRQMLFQSIKRAKCLGFKKVEMGLSAAFEKRKVGATIKSKIGFIQAKDNYSMEMMSTIQKGG